MPGQSRRGLFAVALSVLITTAVVAGFVTALGLLPGLRRGDWPIVGGGLPERPTNQALPSPAEPGPAATGDADRVVVGEPAPPASDAGAAARDASESAAAPVAPAPETAAAPPAANGPDRSGDAADAPHEHPAAAGAPWHPNGAGSTGHRGGGSGGDGSGGNESVEALGSPIKVPPFNQTGRPFNATRWRQLAPLLLQACGGQKLCVKVVVQVLPAEKAPTGGSAGDDEPCSVKSYPAELNGQGQYVISVNAPCEARDLAARDVPEDETEPAEEVELNLETPEVKADDEVEDPKTVYLGSGEIVPNIDAKPTRPGTRPAGSAEEQAAETAADTAAEPATGTEPGTEAQARTELDAVAGAGAVPGTGATDPAGAVTDPAGAPTSPAAGTGTAPVAGSESGQEGSPDAGEKPQPDPTVAIPAQEKPVRPEVAGSGSREQGSSDRTNESSDGKESGAAKGSDKGSDKDSDKSSDQSSDQSSGSSDDKKADEPAGDDKAEEEG